MFVFDYFSILCGLLCTADPSAGEPNYLTHLNQNQRNNGDKPGCNAYFLFDIGITMGT